MSHQEKDTDIIMLERQYQIYLGGISEWLTTTNGKQFTTVQQLARLKRELEKLNRECVIEIQDIVLTRIKSAGIEKGTMVFNIENVTSWGEIYDIQLGVRKSDKTTIPIQ